MTDPTTKPLSPAAQAVKDAALSMYAGCNVRRLAWPLDRPVVVATLRAVADQVVPDEITWASPSEQVRHWPSAYERAGQQGMASVVRRKILLIATELESNS